MRDLPSAGVVVVGQRVSLYVEDDHELLETVTVRFFPFWVDDDGKPVMGRDFAEALKLRPVEPRPGSQRTRAFEIDWTVRLGDDPALPGRTVEIVYEVQVTYAQPVGRAATHMVRPKEKLAVGVVGITRDPLLRRIMLHEFPRPGFGDYEFDDEPLKAHAASLTLEQRRLLFAFDANGPAHRFVAFVTFTRANELRMCADMMGSCAKPNATLSLFHRDRVRREVTLVCHTRHFAALGGTVMHGPIAGKPADEWLRRDNPTPPVFRIAALRPRADARGPGAGMIRHRIFAPDGRDALAGNTLHGMDDATGSWMLFRNFNWPEEIRVDLDRIYREVHLAGQGEMRVRKDLATVGYNAATATELESDSYDKFLLYDRNYAYLWFVHDLVGVKYFSGTRRDGGRVVPTSRADDPGRRVHEYRVHGKELAATFPLACALAPGCSAQGADGSEGTHAYHDLERRHADDTAAGGALLEPDDSLWRANALGFFAASRFLSAETGPVSTGELDACAWAELHLYRSDDLTMADHRPAYADTTLEIHVSGPGGEVLEGAEITASGPGGEVTTARSNRFGVARFAGARPGQVVVSVFRSPYREQEYGLVVESSRSNLLAVRLENALRATAGDVIVTARQHTDGASRPVPGATLELTVAGTVRRQMADAQGHATFADVPPGTHSLAGHAEGLAVEAVALEVVASPGANEVGHPGVVGSSIVVTLSSEKVTRIELLGLTFVDSHEMLCDNTTDYASRGGRFVAMRYNNKFDWMPSKVSRPVSYSAAQTIAIKLHLRLDAALTRSHDVTIRGTIPGVSSPELVFEKKGQWSREAIEPDPVVTAKAALGGKLRRIDIAQIRWTIEIDGKTFGPVQSFLHTVYVTAGKPIERSIQHEPGMDGCTVKRMEAAIGMVSYLDELSTHSMLQQLVKHLHYTLVHSNTAPDSHPGYLDGKVGGAWLIADNLGEKAECQAHVRFMRALVMQLGYEGTFEARMVYPSLHEPTKAIDEKLNVNGGLHDIGETRPDGAKWHVAVLDKGLEQQPDPNVVRQQATYGGLNMFEAFLRVENPKDHVYMYAPGSPSGYYTSAARVLNDCFTAFVIYEVVGKADPSDYYLRRVIHRFTKPAVQ